MLHSKLVQLWSQDPTQLGKQGVQVLELASTMRPILIAHLLLPGKRAAHFLDPQETAN